MKTLKQTMKALALCAAVVCVVSPARADWEMDGTVLSDPDTGWKFTTTSCTYGDVTGLAITGVKQSSSTTTVIDFRNKPLPEGKPILCLGNNSAAWCGGATEIYLPDTIREIKQKAFYQRTALVKIEPFLPASLTSAIGQNAFSGCTNLKGDLFCCVNAGATGFASCQSITSVTLGKNAAPSGTECFSGCSSATNLVLLMETAASLAKGCFGGMSSLREIKFAAKSSVNGDGNHKHFTSMTDYAVKVRVLETTLSSYTSSSKSFTAWDSLEQSVRDQYAANFPGDTETPLGVYLLPIYRGGTSTTPQWLFTYKQDLGDVYKLTVAGKLSSERPSPAYGAEDYESDTFPAVCTNYLYQEGLTASQKPSGEIWECWAGVWERQIETSDGFVWTNIGTNEGHVISYKPPDPGIYRLTWLWKKVGYVAPTVNLPVIPICTVTSETEPSMGTWCRAGEELTYTVEVTDPEARFVRWYGGVSADQAKNTTVTVTVNAGGMTVRPYIDYPYWVGISGGVTDGAWVLKASATGTPPAYTITGHSSGSPDRLMDLTKPIKTGGTFVGLASRSMEYGYGWESPLEMRLPKSFESMVGEVFWGDESITNIVFGSYPAISNTAFPQVKRGSVLWQVPANNTKWVAFVSDRTKLVPWNECGESTQRLWKASGKLPVGIAVGYNGPWVRFLPATGMKLLFR